MSRIDGSNYEGLIVTAMQPYIFPPLHVVHRLAMSDKLIVLDDAQYDYMHTQYNIVSKQGALKLSLSVKDKRMKPFNKLHPSKINRWITKTYKQINTIYAGTQGYKHDDLYFKIHDFIQGFNEDVTVADLGFKTYKFLIDLFGYSCQIYKSSELLPDNTLKGSEWISALSKEVGATLYFQGKTSMYSYFDSKDFEGMVLAYQDCTFNKYTHVDGKEYDLDKMSILDPLFVLGLDATKRMIDQASKKLIVWED